MICFLLCMFVLDTRPYTYKYNVLASIYVEQTFSFNVNETCIIMNASIVVRVG